MQVDEFYQHILGIEAPWEIVDVRLDKPSSVVHVELAHEPGIRWKCPCC